MEKLRHNCRRQTAHLTTWSRAAEVTADELPQIINNTGHKYETYKIVEIINHHTEST